MKYGVTWWAKQWLNSLNKIDYSNRLERGLSYADNGSVVYISYSGNKIIAKVQGTRDIPYNVSIDVPEFSDEQKKLLINIINSNPQILSKLLNNEISPELESLALDNGIRIFPNSWKDFKMRCSCPDWVVPCKHIAAVLYLFANEIDKNPFIIFNLHGLNLLDEFHNVGIDTKNTGIANYDNFFTTSLNKINVNNEKSILYDLDFSKLSSERSSPFLLLAPSPVFYTGDFKELFIKTADKLSNYVEKNFINHEKIKNFNILPLVIDSDIHFLIDDKTLKINVELIYNDHKTLISINDLIDYIQFIQDKHLSLLNNSWLLIYKIYLFSLQLIIKKLYFPRILKYGRDNFILQYIPATIEGSVRTIFDVLSQFLTLDIIKKQINYEKEYLKDQSQELNFICSIFINYFYQKAYEDKQLSKEWDNKELYYGIQELFIYGKSDNFDLFTTREIPQSIHQWLSIFDIHTRRYIPLLKIDLPEFEYEVGFRLSILISDNEKEDEMYLKLRDILENDKYDNIRLEILKDLSLIANYLPQINDLLSDTSRTIVWLPFDDFPEILNNIIPLIRMLGVKVLLPKDLEDLVHPYLAMRGNGFPELRSDELLTRDALLQFKWDVCIGDERIDADEFFELVNNLNGFVKLRDRYLFLNESEIRSLKKNYEDLQKYGEILIPQSIIDGEELGNQIQIDPEIKDRLQRILSVDEIPVPQSLNATLRPYQVRGYKWLVKNSRLGLGSLIADDMGLGKTIQVITLLLHYQEIELLEQALVIVPTSLISNWEQELSKFAPTLRYYSYYGNNRKKNFDNYDVIITSYGIIRRDLETFYNKRWQFIILDEAQNIKTVSSKQTKDIKKLQADIHIAMTGTPVENRLTEYWSIFDFINTGYLPPYYEFREEYVKPIHYNHDMQCIERFRRITSPFILRRLKTDKSIISDLPEKIENNYYTNLTKSQTALYESVVQTSMEKLKAMPWDEDYREVFVLKLILDLKQISNHPYQFLKQGSKHYSKSGKAMLLLDIVDNIIESGEKVLIFTQFKEMGDLLVEFIKDRFDQEPLFLHGGCTRAQRDDMIWKFQNSYPQVFILSIKAGGQGLNLTAANHVIHYDLWWNPAVEAQATDRAFRIGQKKNVMVYRLINKGTIEEKIDKLISNKKELAALTVNTGETWIGNLSNDELKDLLRLEE
jgi:SNF2 family DNA or RNA helicase/uncharacterized Zn finger protein